MSSPGLFADGCTLSVCYGNAKPTDTHLASTIHAIDDEIFEWLAQRERRSKRKAARRQPLNSNLIISDHAAINAGLFFRRYAMKPMPAKPRSSIAHVEASGTALNTVTSPVKSAFVPSPAW
jgi:hypothetical protein